MADDLDGLSEEQLDDLLREDSEPPDERSVEEKIKKEYQLKSRIKKLEYDELMQKSKALNIAEEEIRFLKRSEIEKLVILKWRKVLDIKKEQTALKNYVFCHLECPRSKYRRQSANNASSIMRKYDKKRR